MILRTDNMVTGRRSSISRLRSPKAWLLLAALLAPLAAACGSDDDDDSSPSGGAGSGGGGGATLTQVAALFDSKSCGTCHALAPAPAANGGLQFDPKNKASIAALVGKSSSAGTCGGMTYVVAGQPGSSLLYKKLTASPGCGLRMPQGLAPLSDSEIATVNSWIMGGAQNN